MPLPTFPLDGGCRCGAVRIRVSGPPLLECACHCPGCQRMSASAFSLTALCDASTFEVVRGAPVVGGLRAPELRHHFCAECMTWMFTMPAALPHVVNVRPTLLEPSDWFFPFAETYTATRLPWVSTGAVRSFEAFPPPESFDALLDEYRAWRRARA